MSDLMKIVSGLQSDAISRCRKRIEEAAVKAKEEGKITMSPEYGVTSIMKRKHGL
jgi:hypothetical protein